MSDKLTEEIKRTRNIKDNSIKAYVISLKKIAQGMGIEELPDNFEFLTEYKKVMEVISKLQLTTKKNYLTAVLVGLGTDEKYNKVKEKYGKDLDELSQQYRDWLNEQKKSKTQEDNWLDLDAVLKVRQELKDDVNKYKIATMKNPTDKDLNMYQKYLVLSLYTLLKPLRNDYSGDTMEIITEREYKKLKESDETKKNWLVRKSKDKMYFIINLYKTSQKHGSLNIDVDNAELVKIIDNWIKLNPTKYFLINRDDSPMSSNGLTKFINTIFKNTGKKIGASMLRHIYLSDKHKNDKSIKEKEADAKEMGHSVKMAEQYVKKD